MTENTAKILSEMEKEIKIKVPEGYEIDKENSTFECIKFKPKPIKKVETYDDVARELFSGKKAYFIDVDGEIPSSPLDLSYCASDPNNCVTKRQVEKVLAINKLMNVAKYLNKDWKPDWNNYNQKKYSIVINLNTLLVSSVYTVQHGVAVFKSKEATKKAIEILGEETIKLALGDY